MDRDQPEHLKNNQLWHSTEAQLKTYRNLLFHFMTTA